MNLRGEATGDVMSSPIYYLIQLQFAFSMDSQCCASGGVVVEQLCGRKRKLGAFDTAFSDTQPHSRSQSDTRFSSSQPSTQYQHQPSPSPRMRTGNCFRCGSQGHWRYECPLNTPPSASKSKPHPVSIESDFPAVSCRCGYGPCEIRTAKNDRNSGRKYYNCPIKMGWKCESGFIKWCNEVKEEDTKMPPPLYKRPVCACGAGVCKMETDKGRRYFVCPVKKSHGACSFILWEDDMLANGMADIADMDELSDMVDSSLDHSKRLMIGDDPQCSPTTDVAGAQETEDKILEETGHNRTPELSTPPNVVDQLEAAAIEDSQDIVMMDASSWVNAEVELLQRHWKLSPAEICSRLESEFGRKIPRTGGTHITVAIDPNSGLYFAGWFGKLAYPPSQSLSSPNPRPFFCGTFPSFYPIPVPKEMTEVTNVCTVELPDNPACIESDNITSNLDSDSRLSSNTNGVSSLEIFPNVSIVGRKEPNFDPFLQAALFVQNQLITHLESASLANDPKSMMEASQRTFKFLETCCIDCKAFPDIIKEFIDCHLALSNLNESIERYPSLDDLKELHIIEKKRFDNISHAYNMAKASLETSSQRLQELGQQVSDMKDMLLAEMSKTMFESERRLQASYEEVEKVRNLLKEREERQGAAKRALERARQHLG